VIIARGPPVIEPDRWQRLAEVPTDPDRRINPGNASAPRWLLSGRARCRVREDGQHHARLGDGRVRPGAGQRVPVRHGSCCATPAIPAGQDMTQVMIARLSHTDIPDLLPAPSPVTG
jgi:hypothetical protein